MHHRTEGAGVRSSGEHFPCELSIAKFELSGQKRRVIILRDITERKKMEREKAEFVSVVSHELRTPLTAIRGSLGLLRGGVAGELPKLCADMVALAYDNTDRLGRMINDLLDMQKIESGKMEFNCVPNSLSSLLDSALASNKPYGAQLGVNIAIEGSIPDLRINIDEGRFQQVMSNLLSNACKFSPRDSTVILSASKTEDGRVKVTIGDKGRGIPAEFRERIFNRFSQADSSATRAKGGSGLGLSIARDIVLQMQGEIDYESVPGQGTVFFITFPVFAS
jgi:signal transduction histidine kinase